RADAPPVRRRLVPGTSSRGCGRASARLEIYTPLFFNTEIWRRGRDSTPRYPLRYTRFRGARIRPLCHLSAVAGEAGSAGAPGLGLLVHHSSPPGGGLREERGLRPS